MQPSALDKNECKKWKIPKDKLSKIIVDCENIDGVSLHHLF